MREISAQEEDICWRCRLRGNRHMEFVVHDKRVDNQKSNAQR